MEIKKIDPWLLVTIADTAGFPNKPYDLTKVKSLTKWHNRLIYYRDTSDWEYLEKKAYEILILGRCKRILT